MFRSWMGFRLVCGIGLCVAFTASQSHAARYRLMAVAKNGVVINPPVSSVPAVVGDEITCEIRIDQFASDFNNLNPPGARSYQATVDILTGAASGGNGAEGPILPKGWDAPYPPVNCVSNADCVFAPNLTCNLARGICTGPAHLPNQGFLLNQAHPSFFSLGLTAITDLSVQGLTPVYFSLIQDEPYRTDQNPANGYYGGTVILQVKPFACGTYTFGFVPNVLGQGNIMTDGTPTFGIVEPSLIPLTITVGTCPQIKLAADPPNCAIDARRPHPPTNTTAEGITSLLLTFDTPTTGMLANQFSSSLTPSGGLLVGHTVSPLANNQLRINYVRQAQPSPLDPNRWRCTRHIATNRENCVGGLAGDVNQSRTTNSSDVTALRDLLTPAVISAPLHQCDLDRSTRCSPQDILTAVDLINGADQFASWNNANIPVVCPSQ